MRCSVYFIKINSLQLCEEGATVFFHFTKEEILKQRKKLKDISEII